MTADTVAATNVNQISEQGRRNLGLDSEGTNYHHEVSIMHAHADEVKASKTPFIMQPESQ